MKLSNLAKPRERATFAVALAEQVFAPNKLRRAERRLIRRSVLGARLRPRRRHPVRESVRSSLVRWLASDANATVLLSPFGIASDGLTLEGPLDLRGVRSGIALTLHDCVAESIALDDAVLGPVDLSGLRASALSLNRATIRGDIGLSSVEIQNPEEIALSADGADISGSVYLNRGAHLVGGLSLLGTTIGAQLRCEGSYFENPGGCAVDADRLKVGGSVRLTDGASFSGEVRFRGADFGGPLHCTGGVFTRIEGTALGCDRLRAAAMSLDRAHFKGEVRMIGASISGQLSCEGSDFENPGGDAFSADGAEIGAGVFLDPRTHFIGSVRFLGAVVHTQFACRGTQFDNKDGRAFGGDGMRVTGGLIMSEARFAGTVRFVNAVIESQVAFRGSKFSDPGGTALSLEGADVHGAVFLDDGAEARGPVNLVDARIRGQLSCIGGHFESAHGASLDATRVKIAGDVLLKGATFEGTVAFTAGSVGDILDGSDCSITGSTTAEIALDVDRVTAGALIFPDIKQGRVTARGARVIGDLGNWNCETAIDSRDLSYRSIDGGSADLSRRRADALAGADVFDPGSFEQLATAYRSAGHDAAARSILLRREQAITKRGGYGRAHRAWRCMQSIATGYGFRANRSIYLALAAVAAGTVVALCVSPSAWTAPGQMKARVQPESMRSHPALAVAYAIDTFLPIVDLGDQSSRVPRPDQWLAWALEKSLILIGWILSTVIVVAFTGAVVRGYD